MLACLAVCIILTVIMQYSMAAKKRESAEKKKQRVRSQDKGNVTSKGGVEFIKCENEEKPQDQLSLNKRKNMWHIIQEDNVAELYAYSAIYDNRTAGGRLPLVRILAVGRTIQQLFCQLWFPELVVAIAVKATIAFNGAGHRIAGVLYKQYYFSCTVPTSSELPSSILPSHVSLSTNHHQCDSNVSNLIPITIPERPHNSSAFAHEFGVCVPITFWFVDPYRIVEWIEINRFFGVTEINVYLCNVSKATVNVFRHFRTEGILKIHNLPSPINAHTRNGVKLASPTSINDCMWRNMYRYRYVLIIDFDEIIVPKLHTNYKEMLRFIDREYDSLNYKSYTFRNTYFWVGCDGSSKRPESYINSFTHREEPSKFGFSAKSFLDPRKCLSAFNHYCLTEFSSLKTTFPPTIAVASDIAKTHHYRNIYKKDVCDSFNSTAISDKTLSNRLKFVQSNITRHYSALQL